MQGGRSNATCPAGPGLTRKLDKFFKKAVTPDELIIAAKLFNLVSSVVYVPGVPCAGHLMKCIADLNEFGKFTSACHFSPGRDGCDDDAPDRPIPDQYPGIQGLYVIGQVLGLDLAGRLTEESLIDWWRKSSQAEPLGITRSLLPTIAVGTWPVIPRPQPPAGNPVVAPMVIGNLHDGQTPYKNAQRMLVGFPNGGMLTTQFYGHGLQVPRDVAAVVKRYEDEMSRGVPPTYDDEAAKLLCVKCALEYLKYGKLMKNHVCKAGTAKTHTGTSWHYVTPFEQILV